MMPPDTVKIAVEFCDTEFPQQTFVDCPYWAGDAISADEWTLGLQFMNAVTLKGLFGDT